MNTMRERMIYFFYFSFMLKISVCLLPPKYLYPLGGDSFTYEVVNNQDGLTPKNTDCFTVGPSHPSLMFSALYFDRTSNKFADVRIPADNNIKDIAFTTFFKSDDGNGFVFHYRSDFQGQGDFITDMFVKLVDGKVTSQIDSSSSSASPLSFPYSGPPHYFNLSTWTMISFTNSYIGTTTRLYVDILKEEYKHPFKFPLATPGTLRFGAGMSPQPIFPFKGFLTCGALFNTVSGFNNVTSVLQYCSEINWPNTPPAPKCKEWFLNVNTYHRWPLDNSALTLDVQTLQANNNKKCIRFGKTNPNLPHAGIRFDGSFISSIELLINGNEVDGDFSLLFYVFLEKHSSGTLMTVTDTNEQILIQLTQLLSGLTLEAYNSGSNCVSKAISVHLVPETWVLIGIQRKFSTKKMFIVVNNVLFQASDSCDAFGLSTSVYVKIGSHTKRAVGFHGTVRCLLMFDKPLATDLMETMNHFCSTINSSISGPTNHCSTLDIRSRNYLIHEWNAEPISYFQPLVTDLTSKSLSGCGILCYSLEFCRSFTYKSGICTVYDILTDSTLTVPEVIGYYMIEENQ